MYTKFFSDPFNVITYIYRYKKLTSFFILESLIRIIVYLIMLYCFIIIYSQLLFLKQNVNGSMNI